MTRRYVSSFVPCALLLASSGCDAVDRVFGGGDEVTEAAPVMDAGAGGSTSRDGGDPGTGGGGAAAMVAVPPSGNVAGGGGTPPSSAGEGGAAGSTGSSGGAPNTGGTVPFGTGGSTAGIAGGAASSAGGPGALGSAGSSSGEPRCGDGLVTEGEQCDPGGSPSDMAGGCAADCTLNGCTEGDVRLCAEGGALGNCALGEQICENGVYGECSVTPAAADSCVAGDDADCDGYPNEDCGCTDGTTRNCAALGNCALGEQTCENGVYGPCSVQPAAADSCSVPNDDADCDGVPNSGCACQDGDTQSCGPSTDAGRCEFGTSTCSGGQWGACVGGVYPAARDCTSSADNDCDGSPDNTVSGNCACTVGMKRACDQHPGKDGFGMCVAGEQVCQASADGGSSFWGSCTGAVGPQPADSCTVSGNDGNCDGVLNGGCECVQPATTTCAEEYGRQGDCGEYTLSCGANGQWPAEATACAARTGDSCAPAGQCIGGVWDSPTVEFDEACWQ